MSIFKFHTLRLDVNSNRKNPKSNEVIFNSNDYNSAKFIVTLLHDDDPIDLTGSEVKVSFGKPDDTIVFQDCSIINATSGKIEVIINSQALLVEGKVKTEFNILQPDDTVINTYPFYFTVVDSVLDDSALESANELPTIFKAIEAGEKLQDIDIDVLANYGEEITEMQSQVGSLEKKTPWKTSDFFTSASVQSILDSAADGDTIYLASGRYTISSQVSVSGKQIHIVALGNVVFVEQTPLNVPMLKLTNAHNSTIRGISCEGAETLVGFAGASDKDYCFIKVITSDNVKIYDPNILNKTYGVILENCNKCKIYNPDVKGFLVTGSLEENGANYSSGIYISGGKKNQVINLSAKDMGSGVLIGGEGVQHTISGGFLENVRDNGIYISSGRECKVIDIDVNTAVGTGVKVRGSKHKVKHCYVNQAKIGYVLTGNGLTPDSLGANGYGTVCSENTAENCTIMGVEIGFQDGLYPRDFRILNNTLVNCGEVGAGYASIKIPRGTGHKVKGNIIDGCASDFGILVTALVSDKGKRYEISGNTIRGNGTTPKNGIRAVYMDDSIVSENIFESLFTNGVDCRYVTNSTFNGNEYPQGLVVSLSTSYQSSGNIVSNNIGSNISPDLTQNTAYGNKPESKNYHTSIAAAPYAIGQKAIVSGIIYEAIGTSSASDWKQIS